MFFLLASKEHFEPGELFSEQEEDGSSDTSISSSTNDSFDSFDTADTFPLSASTPRETKKLETRVPDLELEGEKIISHYSLRPRKSINFKDVSEPAKEFAKVVKLNEKLSALKSKFVRQTTVKQELNLSNQYSSDE